FQVGDEGSGGSIGGGAVFRKHGKKRAVLIPRLAGVEDLNITHSTLDEAAGDETTGPVVPRHRIVDTIEFFDVLGFIGNVERFFCRLLHIRRQFVAGDAGLKIKFTGMAFQVLFVETSQEIELSLLWSAGEGGGRIEIE